MDIVVFDDNIQFLEYMKNTLSELNIKHNGAFGVPTYFNETEKVLAYAESSNDNFNFYILDIMNDDMQIGFDLCKRIKEINPDNIIIYITDYKEKIIFNMKHKMLALGFILKNNDMFHSELEECLLKAKEYLTSQFFIGKRRNTIIRIRLNEIYYFQKEKNTGYVNVFTKDNCNAIWDLLNNIIKRLNSDFCYSTKECIVNRQAIRRIDKTEKTLHFENGNKCPYSIYHQKELLEWIQKK